MLSICKWLLSTPTFKIYPQNFFSLVYVTQQEESIEKVIKDTECLFKSREKEYQETIDQIEVKVPVCVQFFLKLYQGHYVI